MTTSDDRPTTDHPLAATDRTGCTTLGRDRTISDDNYWRINQDAPDPFIDSVPAMRGRKDQRDGTCIPPFLSVYLRQGADDRDPAARALGLMREAAVAATAAEEAEHDAEHAQAQVDEVVQHGLVLTWQ